MSDAAPARGNIRFYMTPGSCSTGIHILLEELELVFEACVIDLLKGDSRTPAYLAMNPKGTIPTLVTQSGEVLTDYVSIAWWLGRTYPRAGFIPQDLAGELRALEILNYAVQVIHGQGFTRIFTTDNYLAGGADTDAVVAQGKALVKGGFRWIESLLSQRPLPGDWVAGSYSVADPALFYVCFWADRTGIDLPLHCAAHFHRMLERPAVRQVLAEEGYGAFLQQHPPGRRAAALP